MIVDTQAKLSIWIYVKSSNCLLDMTLKFLAAQSSSRSLVVGLSVGWSVGRSVRDVCEKVTFRVSTGN